MIGLGSLLASLSLPKSGIPRNLFWQSPVVFLSGILSRVSRHGTPRCPDPLRSVARNRVKMRRPLRQRIDEQAARMGVPVAPSRRRIRRCTACRSCPSHVIGIEFTSIPKSVIHSSLPVRESNARNLPSSVAPMKTRPPAVTMDPPLVVGVPVLGTPSLSNSANESRGPARRSPPNHIHRYQFAPWWFLAGPVFAPSQK